MTLSKEKTPLTLELIRMLGLGKLSSFESAEQYIRRCGYPCREFVGTRNDN